MIYPYECNECGARKEISARIGQAPKEPKCDECGGKCRRVYDEMSFILKGGGWPSKKGTFNKEMTERNERAGRRMRKEHGDGPVKLVAHDYGDGDVREVKK